MTSGSFYTQSNNNNKSFSNMGISPISSTKRNKNLISARNEPSKNHLIGDDDISLLKLKILIQLNTIKEYEDWTHLLLSIVGDKTSSEDVHVDLGTPIQKRLQKIEDLQNENFKIKQQIINQINQNTILSQQIQQKKNEIEIISKEAKDHSNMEKIEKEKKTLLSNIQTFANELDEQSEKNKKFHVLLAKNNGDDYKTYNNANREMNKLKEDNVILKKILEVQNHKNNMNYYPTQQSQKYYKTRPNYTSRRLGNYTVEQEEDLKNSEDFIFFTCGGGKK